MLYNFKKDIYKNDNNLYCLNIIIPKNFKNTNYKIYNNKFLLQSGYIENSKIINKINIFLEKLETIFILVETNKQEYFELINLKNLYTKIIENIKIDFKKSNELKMNNIFLNDYKEFLNQNDEEDSNDENSNDENSNDEDSNDEDSNDEDSNVKISIESEEINNILENELDDDEIEN